MANAPVWTSVQGISERLAAISDVRGILQQMQKLVSTASGYESYLAASATFSAAQIATDVADILDGGASMTTRLIDLADNISWSYFYPNPIQVGTKPFGKYCYINYSNTWFTTPTYAGGQAVSISGDIETQTNCILWRQGDSGVGGNGGFSGVGFSNDAVPDTKHSMIGSFGAQGDDNYDLVNKTGSFLGFPWGDAFSGLNLGDIIELRDFPKVFSFDINKIKLVVKEVMKTNFNGDSSIRNLAYRKHVGAGVPPTAGAQLPVDEASALYPLQEGSAIRVCRAKANTTGYSVTGALTTVPKWYDDTSVYGGRILGLASGIWDSKLFSDGSAGKIYIVDRIGGLTAGVSPYTGANGY